MNMLRTPRRDCLSGQRDGSWTRSMISALSGKRILITGGSGFIGPSILAALQDVACHVSRLSRTTTPQVDQLTGKATIKDLTGDVRDASVWAQVLEGVDVVIHLAGQTSATVAEQDPGTDWQANVAPMLHLLECCRQRRAKPLILFSGTVTQAGIAGTMPVDEARPDHPITIYDLHKLIAEQYLKYYCEQGIVRGAVLRLANVYGPGPLSSAPDRGILNMMVRKALAGETLTVYGSGRHLRDYVYVDDVALAFLAAATNAERIHARHFVIGSGQGHLLVDAIHLVADRVASRTGRHVPVEHVDPPTPAPPIACRDFVADVTAFSDATGWTPRVTLQTGIDRTVEAFL